MKGRGEKSSPAVHRLTTYFFDGVFAGVLAGAFEGAAVAVPMLISSAEYIFILASISASMTTREPTLRSVFLAGLSFIIYFVVFSSMMVTGLLSLSFMVKVSAVTAVTVPTIGSP